MLFAVRRDGRMRNQVPRQLWRRHDVGQTDHDVRHDDPQLRQVRQEAALRRGTLCRRSRQPQRKGTIRRDTVIEHARKKIMITGVAAHSYLLR